MEILKWGDFSAGTVVEGECENGWEDKGKEGGGGDQRVHHQSPQAPPWLVIYYALFYVL